MPEIGPKTAGSRPIPYCDPGHFLSRSQGIFIAIQGIFRRPERPRPPDSCDPGVRDTTRYWFYTSFADPRAIMPGYRAWGNWAGECLRNVMVSSCLQMAPRYQTAVCGVVPPMGTRRGRGGTRIKTPHRLRLFRSRKRDGGCLRRSGQAWYTVAGMEITKDYGRHAGSTAG